MLVQVWVGSRHENYEVNPRVRAALAGCTFHVAQSRARAACCHFRRSGPESRAGQPSRACCMCPFVRACVRCAHAVSRARQCCAGAMRCARHARAKADAAASPHGACVCRRSCRTTLCARWTTTPRTGAMAPPSPSARPVPVAAWSLARLRPARPTAGTRAPARALTHTPHRPSQAVPVLGSGGEIDPAAEMCAGPAADVWPIDSTADKTPRTLAGFHFARCCACVAALGRNCRRR